MHRSFFAMLMNVVGCFLLIILSLALTFATRFTMTMEGVVAPVESCLERDFFYVEMEEDLVIPLGLGGVCDRRFYEVIQTTTESYLCIAPREVRERYHRLLDHTRETSLFFTTLRSLSPSRHRVVFLVRPSSFALYHEIAAKVLAMGFEVGWFPLDAHQPLVFNVRGKHIGTQ